MEFGANLKKEFPLDSSWTNLNHGSFGTVPKTILLKQREYQDKALSCPDQFMWFEYPRLVEESRAAVAELVQAPLENLVLLGNATEGLSTVFRSLHWESDDVILHFSTIYDITKKAIEFTIDHHAGKVSTQQIHIEYPIEDEDILSRFKEAVETVNAASKTPRICVFDLVSSQPAGLFPWQAMVKACKELGILSMVDAAQGVGMVKLNLAEVDPDFLVSSCHKWLFVPHSCSIFYVPRRNQHLLTSTLATSRGYLSIDQRASAPTSDLSKYFVKNFEFVGTKDVSAWLTVKDAIAYRRDVLGGEENIMQYLTTLNKDGSKRIAERLGTCVLENAKGTLTNCALSNIALPVWLGMKGDGAKETDTVLPPEEINSAMEWMLGTVLYHYKTSMPLFLIGNRFFVRISAQVYLGLEDYDYAADTIEGIVKGLKEKVYLKPS
ncbi:hypothetical protein QQS21_000397 [Conoideocrella luteorostrata]|uniref:Aminotransferase class V domain-containing protein n=1 Tax=Conoideocrella luteorostrata TaxID=1105319 RepID=A0AAJ0D1P5_9HYPO|nr:hypothetical protein QQS21_000397 [Conoideocrella luteorostrata]